MQIDERRAQRWRKDAASGIYNRKTRASNQKSYNALTPAEDAIVNQMIASKEYADASCRVLSIETLNI